ncbi:MAG TPA: sensor histidine kinase [Bryobacteraceae bacterium]|nr:sensor histidine kinase [Bryobacteraceae bacterium]
MTEDTPHSDLTLPCLIHDLNNVFQTLVEAADLLSTDPRWAALSAAIVRSVERGKNLTASLQRTDPVSAPLETVLANAISFVQDSLIGGRGPKISFATEIDAGIELRRIWGWERVLINLFSNAVRAMPEGGTIRVGARRRETEIEIVVEDDGPGIAPEIMPYIFKPHVSTRGSGLGLHIVDSIVRQEDGFVRALNRPEGGARFIITIPAFAARAAHA